MVASRRYGLLVPLQGACYQYANFDCGVLFLFAAADASITKAIQFFEVLSPQAQQLGSCWTGSQPRCIRSEVRT
ncbi:MAG: hypothetical protein QF752_05365 [Planctomycetota bacterium]|nr:hypothetical protein [Planctomycetota bacterium]